MSQASTWSVPGAGPGTMSAFAGRAISSYDAILTNHSGVGRPSYATAHTTWLKIVSGSAWELYLYDGSDDILIGTFNPVANTFTLASTGLGFATSAVCRNDVTPLSFVNGRVVATQGANGEGAIELKGKTTGSYDASALSWTNGNTGATFFDLISNAGTGLKLRDSAAADVMSFMATGDINSKLWGALADQIVPPGSVVMGPWTSAPSGFVVANGGTYSRTTYARAWAAIVARGKLVTDATWLAGAYAAFSSGDGSTNFRVPAINGYFLRGVYDESSYTIGTYALDKFASHNHGVTESPHTHTASGIVSSYPTWGAVAAGGARDGTVTTSGATTGITINNAGSGSETMPRNAALLACVKI